MNCLVTYASKYGYSEQYARWIAEALDCDLRECKKVDAAMLKQYDIIIHGSGLYAGGLAGIRTITKYYPVIREKHLILFSCGLADPENPDNVKNIRAGIARSLTKEMQEHIRLFHFRGGISYPQLNIVHRAMMGMLRKGLLDKGYENLRGEDKLLVDTYGQTVDFRQKEAIEPLVEYVKGL